MRALSVVLLLLLVGFTIGAGNDADITVMPCSAWADTQYPVIPPFTRTDVCAGPDGQLLYP